MLVRILQSLQSWEGLAVGAIVLAALARMGKENQAGAMARLAAWIKRQVQFLIIMRTQGPVGAPDRDVAAAATAAGRILISLDRGLGDIRAYPPGSHAGIVVLRLTDQSAAAAIKAVSDLATLTDLDSLAGGSVLQRGLLRIRHP